MSTISQKVSLLVQDALDRIAPEECDYDVSIVVVPAPNGGPQPLLAVTMVMSAVTLGDNHSGCVMIQPAVPSQDAVDDLVRQMVTGLRQAKRQAAESVLASSNGHGDIEPTRLIVPGQG